MDLQFVNVSHPKDLLAGGTRSLVRSHAMRHFRLRQRQTQASDSQNSYAEDTLQTTFTKKHLRDELPDAEDENKGMLGGNSDSALVFRGAGSTHLDIFPTTLPQRDIYSVFDHYGAAIAGSFLPLGKFIPANPLRTRILPLAVSDAGLFHIILANAGMDMMVWRQEQFFDPLNSSSARGAERGTLFCTRHKLEGIRVVNAKLKDPVLSVSDETILAVCHLAGLEVSSTYEVDGLCLANLGELLVLANVVKDASLVNEDGLEQMVRLRGGLRRIGWDTCLTQMIIRIDHLYSALTGAKPRFSAKDVVDEEPEEPVTSPARALMLPITTINPELYQILLHLREASKFLEALENPVSEYDFFCFGIKRIRIEDSLFTLGTTGTKGQKIHLTKIDQCCQIASMLYVQTVLTKVNCKVYRSLVTALRRSLEQVDIKTLNESAPSLLLWMLLVGGGAAPYNEDRSWFLRNLTVCLTSELWTEIVERLEGWPWRPQYCSSWRMIWRNAVTKKTALSVAKLTPALRADSIACP